MLLRGYELLVCRVVWSVTRAFRVADAELNVAAIDECAREGPALCGIS